MARPLFLYLGCDIQAHWLSDMELRRLIPVLAPSRAADVGTVGF